MTETSNTATGAQKPKWGKFALSLVVGGVSGFVGALAVLNLTDGGALGDLETSHTIALLVATLYLIMGLAIGLGVMSPAFGSRFLNVEDAEELRETRQSLIASVIGIVAMGAILAIITLAAPGGMIAPALALIIIATLALIATFASIRTIKASDELVTAMNRETASLSYYLAFVVIGGWAAFAHMDLVRAPAMLDLLTAFWVLVLIAAFWVCGRRGLLTPR